MNTRPLPPNKRRRIPKVSLDSTTNVTPQPQPSNTLTLDALDIVQSQHLLDIKTKNTNLQKLIDELTILSTNHNNKTRIQDKTKDKQLNHKLSTHYKQQYKDNSIFESGDNIQDNTWCVERDEYVYDPHLKGLANTYDNCNEALYPSNVKQTGYEALLVALNKEEELKEWKVLQLKNYYLGTKLSNDITSLQLNIHMYDYFGIGYDYFKMNYLAESRRLGTPLPSKEEETANFDRLEGHLSNLSNTNLIDYVKVSNLDLRQSIAKLSSDAPIDENFMITFREDQEYGMTLVNEYEQVIKDQSLKFLPGTRGIRYEPLLEIENYWLSEKLLGVVLMLKMALLEEKIYNDDAPPDDDDESIVEFLADGSDREEEG